ncbi:hypothetical protein RIF29_38858 [Crotalaria pallida]|uniref:Cystatin domain-containing protein n=1 Tax=Crotalaria pallida TaxID=3830 RepID=A0AAN9E0S0_CROPI
MLTDTISISRLVTPSELGEGKRQKLDHEENEEDFSMYENSSKPCIRLKKDGTFYKNKARLLLEDQIAEYSERSDKLSAFDAIPPPPNSDLLGGVAPHPITDALRPHLKYLCELALEHFNNDKGTNLVFVDFVKSTRRVAAGYVYYTTFQARDATESDSAIQTLQAEVWDRRPKALGPVVEMCRIKLT